LFCGAGGFSLGLQWAEFDIRLGLDNDREAIKTFRYNFGDIALDADASLIDVEQICSRAGIKDTHLTIVVGGPPCQGFSYQRRGQRDDPRNHLVKTFLDLALGLNPRFFIIENVLGLMSRHGHEIQQYVGETAALAGYVCHTAKLNAAEY